MEKYKLKNCSLQYNSSCVHNHTNVAFPSPSPSPKVSENSPCLTSESLMLQKQIYRTYCQSFWHCTNCSYCKLQSVSSCTYTPLHGFISDFVPSHPQCCLHGGGHIKPALL